MTDRPGPGEGRCLGGRYRMGSLLATGGMGEVRAARDLLLDRAVAVKVLGGALAADGRAAERLRREARAAARLDHPNIARVLDLGEQDGRPYLVMELLEGESLAARVERAGPMPPAEAARVVATVADALDAAHRAGVVHRDVKPGNIFLTSTGGVKVLDFGIAWCAHEAALTTGDLLGTPAYLAPERVLGRQATPAADIYSLGVVLHELLAGRRPFEAGSDIELAMAHVHADPEPVGLIAPSTPPFLAAACAHAMAKDPSARPPTAAAFAALLRSPPAADSAGLPRSLGPAAGLARPFGMAATAPTRPLPPAIPTTRPPVASPPAGATRPAPPSTAGRRPPRPGRRGLLVALLLAAAVLAALPALSGGLPAWVGERVDPPSAVEDPGVHAPTTDAPGPSDTRVTPTTDPGPETARPDPPAGDDPPDGGGDGDQDGESSGPGGPGGGDSRGGGSSGPG